MFRLSSEEWVSMRSHFVTALSHKDLTVRLQELETKYDKHDKQFKDVYDAINFLLQKDNQDTEQKKRKRIGFKSEDQ